MASNSSNATSSPAAPGHLRRLLAIDTPPLPLAKEKQGADNDLPLSPQWLLPKPGENKELSPRGFRSDAAKASGNSEDINNSGKKRDVFRSSVLDGDSGRRDRWRDDERESNSVIRRTRWRETDKELGEVRKVERWSDDSSRHTGEPRRATQDRWSDSTNKDGNYDQRRENKWSTRWGPDDNDGSRFVSHGKDGNSHEKESERDENLSRSWKSSYPVGRGRGDSSHSLSQATHKPSGMTGYGRGKMENESSIFPNGRGRFNSSTSRISAGSSRPFHIASVSDKSAGASGDRSTLRYTRMKLLDVYRTTNIKNNNISLDGLKEASLLTEEEPLEPLALFAPTSEEAVVLKGIDKGEIVSSGVHQVSKDGSVGKTNMDSVSFKQGKLGNREDLGASSEDSKNDALDIKAPTGEVLKPEISYAGPQRSRSIGDPRLGSSSETRLHVSTVLDQESIDNLANSNDASVAGKFESQTSPENLSLYYKDPQGAIQGPFTGADIIGWFESGYFGIDLQVRLASAQADARFSLLGDVMPHLRAKARPPPGFAEAKQSDTPEPSPTGKFVASGSNLAATAAIGMLDSEPVIRNDNAIEAQNRFLESLMSNNMRTPASQSISITGGMNEYGGNNFGIVTSGAGDSGNNLNYLLAQKRLMLERQKSLQNSLPHWSGGDAVPMPQKLSMVQEGSSMQSKLLPPMADPSLQFLQSQNVDLLSLLHSADKPQPPAINAGLPLWSNFSEARNLNTNMHGVDGPQGVGVQKHGVIAQNQPPLTHVNPNSIEFSSGLVPPEKLLSELSQEQQMLNLVQQQYLLSQMQLPGQTPVLTSQQSLLDKMLLLKQQQQQEHQKQQLLWQQHHLLSQVPPRAHPGQNLDDPSVGPRLASVQSVDPSQNVLGLRTMHEVREIGHQLPVHRFYEGHSNHPNVNLRSSDGVSSSGSSGPSLVPLPHQIIGHVPSQAWDFRLPQQKDADANAGIVVSENLPSIKEVDNQQQEVVLERSIKGINKAETGSKMILRSQTSEAITESVREAEGSLESSRDTAGSSDMMSYISNQVREMKMSEENITEDSLSELAAVNEVKNSEVLETKKGEKKTKKQKKKQTAIDTTKGAAKTALSQQPTPDGEDEGSDFGRTKHVVRNNMEELFWGPSIAAGNSLSSGTEPLAFQTSEHFPLENVMAEESSTFTVERGLGSLPSDAQAAMSNRAWKATSGLRPKSLLEIQAEEELRAQRVMALETAKAAANSAPPMPWNGIASNFDHNFGLDVAQSVKMSSSVGNLEYASNSRSKVSPLHDLLAEEVLAKSEEVEKELAGNNANGTPFLPFSPAVAETDATALDDDDFIEAKDSKKNRKKASKAKNSAVKAPSPVGSFDVSAASMPTEKAKSAKLAQQEKEILPAPPSGPSLGDFVTWKGDQANSVPAPAWSADSGKLQKPLSLRDIQREQERKSATVHQVVPTTPTKMPPTPRNQGNISLQASGSAASKAASPIQISSHASAQSKSSAEDDLFWGPLEQSKQDKKQLDFPSLSNKSGSGVKGISSKESSASSNRQKPSSARLPPSPPPASMQVTKGKAETSSKQTEAMEFRNWCDSEWMRLTGTTDTSFLEYCMGQSTSEAEMLLRENIGALDRNHEFIDKFLNYKAFLSSEIIEMAFQAHSSRVTRGDAPGRVNSGAAARGGTSAEAEVGLDSAGGKKKVKKGKKVSPAALGFNVVSNRIMMGEIQNVE